MAAFGVLTGASSGAGGAGSGGGGGMGRGWSDKSVDDRRKELLGVFEMFDSDGSGSIDAEELFVAMKTLGQRATMEEVEKMIAEVEWEKRNIS